jgi:hypothetical protein
MQQEFRGGDENRQACSGIAILVKERRRTKIKIRQNFKGKNSKQSWPTRDKIRGYVSEEGWKQNHNNFMTFHRMKLIKLVKCDNISI